MIGSAFANFAQMQDHEQAARAAAEQQRHFAREAQSRPSAEGCIELVQVDGVWQLPRQIA